MNMKYSDLAVFAVGGGFYPSNVKKAF